MSFDTENKQPLNADSAPSLKSLEVAIATISADLIYLKSTIQQAEQRYVQAGKTIEQQSVFLKHIATQLDGVHHWLAFAINAQNAEISAANLGRINSADERQDVLLLLLNTARIQNFPWTFFREKEVAYESSDHIHPRGVKNDNTRCPRFVAKCEKIVDRAIRHLDLGCAGGGLVWDFTLAGHLSAGIEGSNYCQLEKRAAWRLIPERLFTADITKPYGFTNNVVERQLFNVITAWELLEHIDENHVDDTIRHVAENLADNGIFVCSIATHPDFDPVTGVTWHVTLKPKPWWVEKFQTAGLVVVASPFDPADFVRGAGNIRANDWNAELEPEKGFHITAMKAHGAVDA